MCEHDLLKGAYASLEDALPRLASSWREGERVVLPGGVLLGIHCRGLVAAEPFPAPVIDLSQVVSNSHCDAVRRRDDRCRFLRTAKRTSVDCGDRFGGQALSQSLGLHPSFVTERDVRGPGEAILGAQYRGAMPDEHHAGGHC